MTKFKVGDNVIFYNTIGQEWIGHICGVCKNNHYYVQHNETVFFRNESVLRLSSDKNTSTTGQIIDGAINSTLTGEGKWTMGGIKHDTGKADLSLNPYIALKEMALAFMWGEKKYNRYNYTQGFESHRLVAAAMRHLCEYQNGEDLDPESTIGSSHLGHALACIAMLLHCEELGTLTDTRYKK